MRDQLSSYIKADYEVIIIGGGIVGLACALVLAQNGFKLAVIEAGMGHDTSIQPAAPFDAKIVAITRKSELFFRQLGIWSNISNLRSCAYQQMKVWDASADGKIVFDARDFFEPNLGYMIEQQVILHTLWQALSQLSNVTLLRQAQLQQLVLQDHFHMVTLCDGRKLISKLIIAADGATSQTRKLAQIQSQGWDYQQSAIVASLKGSITHGLTAFQRFDQDGSLALLPLADLHQCALVWATTTQKAQALYQLEETVFLQDLKRECDNVMGDMSLMGRRWLFPLNTHHAKEYVKERLALIGDAAHTLHPLAGQGVNLGLLDVQALAKILIIHRNKKRDYGARSVLKRYERQRKWHNQAMIWAMECFKRGFTSQNAFLQYARNQGLNWVDRQDKFKQFFAQVALGTWGSTFW